MITAISNNSLIAALFGSGARRAPQAVDALSSRSGELTEAQRANAELLEPVDRAEFSAEGLYAASEAEKIAAAEASGYAASEAAREQLLPNPQSKTADPALRDHANANAGPSRAGADSTLSSDSTLSAEEKARVVELKQRDVEVRRHEAAHKAGAGSVASGAPSFDYTTGPDGKRYAVSGEVSIDTSTVSGDPRATIAKMQQIRRAALAPAHPSGQDRAVAAQSAAAERQARAELAQERQAKLEDSDTTTATASLNPAASGMMPVPASQDPATSGMASGMMRSQSNSGNVAQIDRNSRESTRVANPFEASQQSGRTLDLLA